MEARTTRYLTLLERRDLERVREDAMTVRERDLLRDEETYYDVVTFKLAS